jgi:hypothetical protein
MSNRKGVLLAAVLLGGVSSLALACVIDLPNQLLESRPATFKEAVANSFAFEVAKLTGKADDRMKPFEHQYYYYSWAGPDRRDDERREDLLNELAAGLTPEEAAGMRKLHAAEDDQIVLATEGVPRAVQLYAAGAVAFHHGKTDQAKGHFQAILDLPDDQGRVRVLYAQYMLAELASSAGETIAADALFAKVRELGAAGIPDPSGLAVASYGQQARMHLRNARKLLENGALPEERNAAYSEEISRTVDLYAEQVAHQSESGLVSLRMVSQHILSDESTVTVAAELEKPRRLLVAFILARFNGDVSDPGDTADAEGYVTPERVVEILAEANRRHGTGWLADSDLLANLAYREGQYDVAESLVANTPGPLAAWIKAKLAVQKGDLQAATGYYAEAVRAFPTEGVGPVEPTLLPRVEGESGTLALARGDYVEALRHLRKGGDWRDTAYVAERVLTVDELRHFVDGTIKPTAESQQTQAQWVDLKKPGDDKLRDLLARRLMRAGRFEEALTYFSDRGLRQQAKDYAKAKQDESSAWSDLSRAAALYRRAVLEREAGMGLLGTEEGPDYAIWGGSWAGDVATNEDALSRDYVTEGERQRFEATKIEPDLRYHYRYLAAGDAARAAELLPPRSQAFAAVLCKAADWMIQTQEPDKAWDYYARYVKDGAAVPWAVRFGRACPEPEFSRARWVTWRLRWAAARHTLRNAFQSVTGH